MEHRRRISGIFPGLVVAILVASLSVLNGCGGSAGQGGGTSTNAVNVSLGSAPSIPAGTTFAPSTLSPATTAPPANSPVFDNVFVTVTKLALIPSTGTELPDANGELETPNSSAEEGNGFVTATLGSPVKIDLLNLTGDNVATLLNRFFGVPAGEYSKIRVYYDNVVGCSGSVETLFHPTADYHFDVHFVGGNLVIPETTDPEGGIKFFSVEIDVVGLKYHEAGQSGNVLLRPQVFAKVVGVPRYIVTGVADNVDHVGGIFVVMAPNDNISVNYGSGTKWFYFDERYVGPFLNSGADNALRDTAQVDAIGTFQGGVLTAEELRITFPDTRTGMADNVWILSDTAFIVRSQSPNDNVTVFPMPDRSGAYYDNSLSPLPQLTFEAIDNNIQVKVRGYFNDYPNLDAYWISIEP